MRIGERAAAILVAAGEGLIGLDLDGAHTFVNLAAARMLGYEVTEPRVVASHPGRWDRVSDHLYQHGLTRESTCFLAKPFSPSTLMARMREVLDA